MAKYEYLTKFNIEDKTYNGLTLDEIIENIGYLHMTNDLKIIENTIQNHEKYLKTVQIYTENPQIRKKIVKKLQEMNNE